MNKPFERVLIVMLENQYRSYVMQDGFMRKLARCGATLTNAFGAFHPSQTNYLASLAGEVCGVTSDIPPAAPLPQQTLVDLLEAKGLRWKAYMEGYPGEAWNPAWQQGGYPGAQQPLTEAPTGSALLARYFRKHNAFASFRGIQSSEARWNLIVDDRQFWQDIAAGTLPEYAWFTPDIWNDGHYLHGTHTDTDPRTQLVPQISTWLEYVFFGDLAASHVQGAAGGKQIGLALDTDLLLRDPAAAWKQSRLPSGTLVVVTFDEADFDAKEYDSIYDGPNQVYTVLLGDMIAPGTVVDTPLNHYSLMKTVQRNFGTGHLDKNDRDANSLRFLWGESFAWSAPVDTGTTARGEFALAHDGAGACLVFARADGALLCSVLDGGVWSVPTATGVQADGPIALAPCDGELHLVYTDDGGRLSTAVRTADGRWSAGQILGQQSAGALALTGYRDAADGQSKLMLCWPTADGFIQSLVHAGGAWQAESVPVGQLTDGPLVIAQFGPSLFLVYKERNTRQLRCTSYNLGPFNAFQAMTFEGDRAPANDTSLHRWAPADFMVGHFARKRAALQDDFQALGRLALASIEGEMHLVHRGAYADTPGARSTVFGLTGVFTAANPMGNGFGTLDQAGWTAEQDLPSVQLDPTGGLAVCSDGLQLRLVWRPAGGVKLASCTGAYRSR